MQLIRRMSHIGARLGVAAEHWDPVHQHRRRGTCGPYLTTRGCAGAYVHFGQWGSLVCRCVAAGPLCPCFCVGHPWAPVGRFKVHRTIAADIAPARTIATAGEHQGMVFAVGKYAQLQLHICWGYFDGFPFGHAISTLQHPSCIKCRAASLTEVKSLKKKIDASLCEQMRGYSGALSKMPAIKAMRTRSDRLSAAILVITFAR
jgi:hypothetical protein